MTSPSRETKQRIRVAAGDREAICLVLRRAHPELAIQEGTSREPVECWRREGDPGHPEMYVDVDTGVVTVVR